ncbi:hypothetical protein [Rhodococcus pyridinivorans]|uniref:hypothetical protein n=1 Tax=Rhodococcus pyridinivorans TaxID=103816 RepID=UPI0039B52E7F
MADQLRRDIARARDRMVFPLGAARELRHLESYLRPGEHVDTMCVGTYGGGRGLLVLTDTRVLSSSTG